MEYYKIVGKKYLPLTKGLNMPAKSITIGKRRKSGRISNSREKRKDRQNKG